MAVALAANGLMRHAHPRRPAGRRHFMIRIIALLTNYGHWQTTTFVGGLTHAGFMAPYVPDGPMDGAVFRAWIEQMLAPQLMPKDIVILDNLSSHKVAGVHDAIAARGAETRYLPPYSPGLNLTENAFSKLKALLRKAVERTKEGLWDAIGKLLGEFSPEECQNYIENAGYVRSA